MTVTKAVTGFDDNLMGVVGCQWRSLNRLATLLTRLVGLGEEATFTGTVARAPAPCPERKHLAYYSRRAISSRSRERPPEVQITLRSKLRTFGLYCLATSHNTK
ncbi:hypothetical protein Zmor_014840 [Zophobas morio]|uniref:Uncharacterized protein n=1 Tax=Zophobas morio TaxID=2755281 RepID=A0AA38IGV6_9CUCU|nr:hypothetical protein Zmor_014840 [Zophobas morio]